MNSKQLQKQHERFVCNSLIETLNLKATFERNGNDLNHEPDTIYKVNERLLGIEVSTAYPNNVRAEQEWTRARGEREIPKQGYEWRWNEAYLENLPQIEFPNHLKDKIYYKPREKLLIFKGLMSKEEKDELLRLSLDKQYRNAIEELGLGVIINPDDLICARIQSEINDKCSKRYSGAAGIWLCIEVRDPSCDEDEVNEFLPSIYIPEKHCFDAIYLLLYEGDDNYKVFKIYGNRVT